MGIDQPSKTTFPHPDWCAPDAHCYVGAFDHWHRSEARAVEPDGDLVEVSVEQYADRTAAVLLRAWRREGSDLTPDEARRVARLLLAAADVAQGAAVTR